MDHAIRTVHLNRSVHSSVSEQQDSTKSAKCHTKMENDKSISHSHQGKKEIMEARTQV